MNTLTNTINICFAATPELIPYATVGAISIIKNLKHEFNLNIYFLQLHEVHKLFSNSLQVLPFLD